MRIIDLPAPERPRERLSTVGAHNLADRELLAMVLGTGGARGAGAHTLAERLLNEYGSVLELARAHPADLTRVPGIGVAKASAVVSAFELARRAGRRPTRPVINSTADLLEVVSPLLQGRTRERLVLVTCDGTHRVIACEVLAEGAADRAVVPIREIMVAALRRDGQVIALAHNHPDQDATPSETDVRATVRVRAAAEGLGIRFLDHLVVTDTTWRRVPASTADL